MIRVRASWNDTSKKPELISRIVFRSKFKRWDKKYYNTDSYSLGYEIQSSTDATIGPTCLSTWSK